jgi:hypothetical protein
MSRKAWTSKDRHKQKLLEYLSNPDNDFIPRNQYASNVLGYKRSHAIYKTFTPDELYDIEQQALDNRRKKYASQLAKIDKALFQRALEGDPQAIKLCYQRFEGWSEKQLRELTGKDGKPIQSESKVVVEFVDPEDEEPND